MKKPTQLLAVLLACFVVALACNFPIQSGRSAANSAARETLTARLLPSATALPELNGHPGSTPESQGVSAGLQTAEPDAPLPSNLTAGPVFSYSAQPGDTLAGLTGRFGVSPAEVSSQKAIPAAGLIPDGQLLSIPNHLGETGPGAAVLPDSEIVYSPSAAGFDTAAFVKSAGGFLNSYTETVDKQSLSGEIGRASCRERV
jgi:hypothetical protein